MEEQKDLGAGLIGHAIPDMEGTEPRPNMLSPEERFQRDPTFRTLVYVLTAQIDQAKYTPTELREAAMLACIRYENMTLRKIFVFQDIRD